MVTVAGPVPTSLASTPTPLSETTAWLTVALAAPAPEVSARMADPDAKMTPLATTLADPPDELAVTPTPWELVTAALLITLTDPAPALEARMPPSPITPPVVTATLPETLVAEIPAKAPGPADVTMEPRAVVTVTLPAPVAAALTPSPLVAATSPPKMSTVLAPLAVVERIPSPFSETMPARELMTLVPEPEVAVTRPTEAETPPVTVIWAALSISTLPPPLMAPTPALVLLPVGVPDAPTSSIRIEPVPTVTLTLPLPAKVPSPDGSAT